MQGKNILRIFAKNDKGLVESIETFTARHWHAKNVIRIKSYQSKVAAANSQVFQTSSWRTQMLSNGGLGRRQLSLPPKLLQLQPARTLVPMALIKKMPRRNGRPFTRTQKTFFTLYLHYASEAMVQWIERRFMVPDLPGTIPARPYGFLAYRA